MIRVDLSGSESNFILFLFFYSIRVGPSRSDPDWRSELIRSDFYTCLSGIAIGQGHVAAAWKRSHGTFPWPKTILKQLEEWHVIVSCDQLAETLRATPTLPIDRATTINYMLTNLKF